MQTTKIDVNKQIEMAVRTGKVSFGVKEAIDSARFAKAKLLIMASNCPEPHKQDILQYAKQSEIPIYNYHGSSVDLGSACMKPFVVAILTVKEPGDSEILKLAVR
jgi:large subunit ribosomal protein L30e